MAKKAPRKKKATKHKQTKLAMVRSWPSDNATILDIKHPAPLFLGDEHEDLLCGHCRAPIAVGVSINTLRSVFNAQIHLLVKCPKCRSLSAMDARADE